MIMASSGRHPAGTGHDHEYVSIPRSATWIPAAHLHHTHLRSHRPRPGENGCYNTYPLACTLSQPCTGAVPEWLDLGEVLEALVVGVGGVGEVGRLRALDGQVGGAAQRPEQVHQHVVG